jgi:3-hydroxyacyl-CoA dehydrogenase
MEKIMDQNQLDTIETYISGALRESLQTPNIDETSDVRTVELVGIIGAGTMGGGIAMNFANVGIPVKIVEVDEIKLKEGLNRVRENYQRSAYKGRFPQSEVVKRMSLISGFTSLEELASCDLIIEAVFENIEIKREIFSDLQRITKPSSILATNTSGLDINSIAKMTNRPKDVVGLHFFSPANVMKLLEIVQAKHTSSDIIKTCIQIALKINKIPVLVGVCDGFVGNRILYARQDQANKLVQNGVLPWDIDKALNDFGFKMGPFQMADLAGLDLGWSKGFATGNPIKDALCEVGRRGQKTGKGYYNYDSNRTPMPSVETEKIINEITRVKNSVIPKDQIIEALICPMINEALKILEENKAQRPSDIDIVWLYGYGWPRDKGGLLYYGDQIGPKKILKVMERLSYDDESIKISKLLYKCSDEKISFLDINTGGLIAN